MCWLFIFLTLSDASNTNQGFLVRAYTTCLLQINIRYVQQRKDNVCGDVGLKERAGRRRYGVKGAGKENRELEMDCGKIEKMGI